MAEFLESPAFPGCPNFGYTSQADFSVSIIRKAGGQEERNANWSRSLQVITVTVGPRMEDEIQELLEFWQAVGGQFCGFRFKDYADFKSGRVGETPTRTDQPLVATTDSPQAYQLTKRYTAGARSQDRAIYKPVQGTILIADNGALKTEGVDYSIDYTTGLVDLAFTPAGALTWGGEFDIPVRFASDFPIELVSREIESVQFVLQELRI